MKSKNGFNKDEAISDIIQKFNTIEELINDIIIKNINPQKENLPFTKKFVLHNSIISFGGKLKLFKHINNEVKILDNSEIQNIHKLVSIRNAFAHSPNIDMQPGLNFPIVFPAKFEYHVEISSGSKIFELKSMEKLYNRFNEIYDDTKQKLEYFLSNS